MPAEGLSTQRNYPTSVQKRDGTWGTRPIKELMKMETPYAVRGSLVAVRFGRIYYAADFEFARGGAG